MKSTLTFTTTIGILLTAWQMSLHGLALLHPFLMQPSLTALLQSSLQLVKLANSNSQDCGIRSAGL